MSGPSAGAIAEVKRGLNIVDVIGQYVCLKPQRGAKRYVGLCPFHSEQTPSFTVSAEHQTYKCFGCDASGDVLAFIQEIERTSFVQALRSCADLAGVPIDGLERSRYPRFTTAELAGAEMWRLGLKWKLDTALETVKRELYGPQHEQAAEATRTLTRHLEWVRTWTLRQAAEMAAKTDPALVTACIAEAREACAVFANAVLELPA